jgi:hypothetical protein
MCHDGSDGAVNLGQPTAAAQQPGRSLTDFHCPADESESRNVAEAPETLMLRAKIVDHID